MPLDGFVTASLAYELNQRLVGARVFKVWQPNDTDIVLQMRRHRENIQLLLSAHPQWPRVCTSQGPVGHRAQPPAFCMLLRKYLEPSRLLAVEQPGWERSLHLRFETPQRVGRSHEVTLIVELIPRRANIIVVESDSGHIVDALQRRAERTDERLPGNPYPGLPTQEKLDPQAPLPKASPVVRLVPSDRPLAKHLTAHFHGLSPTAARQILERAGIDREWIGPLLDDAAVHAVVNSLHDVAARSRHAEVKPGVIVSSRTGATDDFWIFPLASAEASWRPVLSTDEALRRWADDRLQRAAITTLRQRLRRVLRSHLDKLGRKERHRLEDLKRAEQADWYRRCADLLTSNLYQLPPDAGRRGQVTVTDWFAKPQAETVPGDRAETVSAAPAVADEPSAAWPQIEIPVDPALSLNANAQRYYRKYSKYNEARDLIRRQLAETRADIAYLQQVALSVQWAASHSELAEIEAELNREGYVRDRSEQRAPRQRSSRRSTVSQSTRKDGGHSASEPYRLTLDHGEEIRVGRNNRQNDELTLRWAQPQDVWLHCKDIPGSHVILRPSSPGAHFSEEGLQTAALLAAWFSKARASENVPVDYTEKRHVRKPRGARPGMVIYDHHRTLFVTPAPEAVAPLLARLEQAGHRGSSISEPDPLSSEAE